MLVLGIESSCDETAAAVLADGTLRSDVVLSQDGIHGQYGGVVPELASRRHLDGIAVTHGPGLVGSLLVGLSVAKAMAYAQGLPLVGVNHLEGHVYAGLLTDPTLGPPFLALVVSGGHTALYACEAPLRYRLVGQTRDDAAGEAFDKVAKLLELGYPGGPVVERTAREGDPKAIAFPVAQFQDGAPDFSFSGLKTAVSLYVGPLSPKDVADFCASFQRVVVRTLIDRTFDAAGQLGARSIGIAGGVSANSRLRADAAARGASLGIPVFVPSLALSTDNAAMIAAAGAARLRAGERADLGLNAHATLPLA